MAHRRGGSRATYLFLLHRPGLGHSARLEFPLGGSGRPPPTDCPGCDPGSGVPARGYYADRLPFGPTAQRSGPQADQGAAHLPLAEAVGIPRPTGRVGQAEGASRVADGRGLCRPPGNLVLAGIALPDPPAWLPHEGSHLGHDLAGCDALPGRGSGRVVRPALANRNQLAAFEADNEDGYTPLRDGGGSPQGTDGVRAGVQSGARRDVRCGAAARGGGGTDQLRRRTRLTARFPAGVCVAGFESQSGAARTVGTASGKAAAKTVRPPEPAEENLAGTLVRLGDTA